MPLIIVMEGKEHNHKGILCLDIDGVLADTRMGLARYCSLELGATVDPIALEKFKVRDLLGISGERAHRLVCGFYNLGYRAFSPYQDSVNVVERLSHFYDLYAISGRPYHLEEGTREWIQRTFQNSIREVLFARAHDLKTPKSRSTKGEICEKLGARFMVDNDSVYSLDCLKRGIPVLYFHGDKPLVHPLAIEVASWRDVFTYGRGGTK